MNKKIKIEIAVGIILFLSMAIVGYLLLSDNRKHPSIMESVNEKIGLCSKTGEFVHHSEGTDRCCDGLSEMGVGCPENNCSCSFPAPGGVIKCSNCGNGICERENLEDHCSCPKDCDILEIK